MHLKLLFLSQLGCVTLDFGDFNLLDEGIKRLQVASPKQFIIA